MVDPPVYLDNHATTRVDPRVVDAMLPFFSNEFGNSGSSGHGFGRRAHDAVEQARASIASAIGADSREVLFTSGATESNNLVVRGLAERRQRRGNHVVSVQTEHKAMLDPLTKLSRSGFEITLLPVQSQESRQAGVISVERLAEAIRDDTMLVSVMLANNEIGVIQPLDQIAALCRQRGVPLHTDATQAVGKIPVDVHRLGVDLMSFSAHKLYGPKGVGVLFVGRKGGGVRLASQIDGGGQERGMRSGTLNVPGIVGLAEALKICCCEIESESSRLADLRDRLFAGLNAEIDSVQLNGPVLEQRASRLAGNLNCSFAGVDGEALMVSAPDVAVSSGSACASISPTFSHVLAALGLDVDRVRTSLRFGLGRFNTAEQIDFAVQVLAEGVERLRKLGSVHDRKRLGS